MGCQIKTIATKRDNLSLILGIHMIRGELYCNFHVYIVKHVHEHTHDTHTHMGRQRQTDRQTYTERINIILKILIWDSILILGGFIVIILQRRSLRF